MATASFGTPRRPAITTDRATLELNLPERPTPVRVSSMRTAAIGTYVVAAGGGAGAVPTENVRVEEVAMTLPAASSALTRQQKLSFGKTVVPAHEVMTVVALYRSEVKAQVAATSTL
jgi:hypothetical protein